MGFNYIIFDCETGGMDKKNNENAINYPMCELALLSVKHDTFEEIGRYETLLKPHYGDNHQYTPEAQAIHGIKLYEMESKGKEAKVVAKELAKFCEDALGDKKYEKPLLVGHNVTFDIPFWQYLFDIVKMDLSKYLTGYKDHKGVFHPIYLDTMWLSRLKWIGKADKHGLGNTMQRAGLEFYDAHRAMPDVIATLDLFKFIATNLRSEVSNENEMTISNFRENFKFEM